MNREPNAPTVNKAPTVNTTVHTEAGIYKFGISWYLLVIILVSLGYIEKRDVRLKGHVE